MTSHAKTPAKTEAPAEKSDEKSSQAVEKETIPNVSEAGNDLTKHKAAIAHAFKQVEAGHYRLSNFTQSDLPEGGVRLSVDRHETYPEVKGKPHSL